jgi:hypothetical protein
MSNIPEARKILRLALADLKRSMRRLRKLEPLMTRPSPVRRAKNHSKRCTPEVAEKIRVFAGKHPAMPYNKIAAYFQVDDGRVSEALRGLR